MKFRPGCLALAPLAPLGAAVAHAALTPRKTSAYQPQPQTAKWCPAAPGSAWQPNVR